MKRTLVPSILLILAATPTLAQKITIDYAQDFDFSKTSTYQYVETEDSNAKDQLMDGRIKTAVLTELDKTGLRQVQADGDLLVTYHIATQDNTVFNTTSMGMGGMGGGWGRWGGGMGGMGMGGMAMGTSTTTASTYTEGTLIVDAYEPSEQKMVWRGIGTVTLKAKPEKITNQINKALNKMGAKWQKILANKDK